MRMRPALLLGTRDRDSLHNMFKRWDGGSRFVFLWSSLVKSATFGYSDTLLDSNSLLLGENFYLFIYLFIFTSEHSVPEEKWVWQIGE